MKLPERKSVQNMDEGDVERLLSVIPHIASYVGACTSKDGADSVVHIQISSTCNSKSWGMSLAIPANFLQHIEHIDGEGIPSCTTVLNNLETAPPVPDGEVIARVDTGEETKL